MKSKVTLKERVGTKIVYAALLACYYWMWARRDWYDYYAVIQHMVIAFTFIFFAIYGYRIRKYGKEKNDELDIQRLNRADAIVFKIMIAATIIIAFASAVTVIDGRMAGCALVGTIVILTVIRFILFCVMSRQESQ